MIFKGVRNGKPYPDHGLSTRDWAQIPPRQFRLDQLTTVTTALALDKLLSEDSTFYGDLFAHAVRWHGEMYLEDGLHRAVRSALRNRHVIHARLLDLDALGADRIETVEIEQPLDAGVPEEQPVDPAATTAPILTARTADETAPRPVAQPAHRAAAGQAPRSTAESAARVSRPAADGSPRPPADAHGWTAPPDRRDAR